MRFGALVLLSSLVLACDPGLLEIKYVWPGDTQPTLPATAVVTVRVEYRLDPREPGAELAPSVTQPFESGRVTIPVVPYGHHRVAILEIRPAPLGEVDWYGLSEPFSVERGEHKKLPVLMGPIQPPQLVPEAFGSSLEIITTTTAKGLVGNENVRLLLTADTRAVRARLSNVPGLPEGKAVGVALNALERVEGAQEGFQRYTMRWNLEHGLESPCRGENYCLRQVHARFIDAQHYASLPAAASVVLDEAPPSLVPSLTTITPAIARADQHIFVNLAASEVVRPPSIRLEEKPRFAFEQVSPPRGDLSASYVFRSLEPAGALGPPRSFTVITHLSDLVGNRAKNLEVGTFAIDTKVPVISDLAVEPQRINGEPGKVVKVEFTISKGLEGGHYRVSVGSRPFDGCEETKEERGRVHVVCRRAMRGDEIPEGTEHVETIAIELEDAAGNAAKVHGVVVFDFKPPSLYAVSIAPQAAKRNDVAQIYVAASEPIASDSVPELTWRGRLAPFVHRAERDTAFERYYELVVSERLEEGDYVLSGLRLRDEAGNMSQIGEALPHSPENKEEPVLSSTPSALLPLTWKVDATPPWVGDLVVQVDNRPELVPPRIPKIAGTRLTVRFVEHESSPRGIHVFVGQRHLEPSDACLVEGEAPARRWSCVYTTDGREYPLDVEQTESAGVELEDAAGNRGSSAVPVVFDYRPPHIVEGSASMQLVLGNDNLLRRIPSLANAATAVGMGTTAFVNFTTEETLHEEPLFQTRPIALPFVLARQSGTAFTYRNTLGEGALNQGPYEVEVVLEDLAGNRVTRSLVLPAPGLIIDTEPPATPNTARITHSRVPWGSDEAGDGPHAFIRAEVGAIEGETFLVVLGDEALEQAEILGASTVGTDGSVPRFELDRPEDRASIFVTVIDSAGNASMSTANEPRRASRVQHGEWIATLRGKAAGSSAENPHEAVKLMNVLDTLEQDPRDYRPLTTEEFARLARTDGQPLAFSTERRWEAIQVSAQSPSARERAAMAYDVVRGRAVMFGGYGIRADGTRGLLNDTWEWDGRSWSPVALAGAHPPERASAVMAYDAVHRVVVLFGGDNTDGALHYDTWLWDGTSWTLAWTFCRGIHCVTRPWSTMKRADRCNGSVSIVV